MVLVQKWPFFQLFFLGNIGQENVFYDILERKNAFLGYKNMKFKSRKIDIFLKGLTNRFGPKMTIFQTCLFTKYKPGKCLLLYSAIKNVFLGYKNKSLKSRKIQIFPKGLTHGFCLK